MDLSDVKPDEKETILLTRGLAAWTLMHRCGLDAETAAGCVTDGFGDNGIDAAWVDTAAKVAYVVQSKWDKKGKSSISLGDTEKFLRGVRDFVNAEFGAFNEKFNRRKAVFSEALEQPELQFRLVIAHTGTQPLSKHSEHAIDSLLADMNDPIETATFEPFSQKELHDFLKEAAKGQKPDISANLRNWGYTDQPYMAYYGLVAADQIAEWYDQGGSGLLAENIRQFLGNSDVNTSMRQTLADDPELFWYLNNGITVLCDKITRAPSNATAKTLGRFQFSGATIVNGAQTAGCIASANRENPEETADAWVTVRFISLEGCPPEFAQEVTRGTNTQNRVERRDFVSLDPLQDDLKLDLGMLGLRYAIKSGAEVPETDKGTTVTEATVALACAHDDVDLSTQAKREVGRLWVGAEDAEASSQYRRLFNDRVTALQLWNAVRLLRAIEDQISVVRARKSGRSNQLGVHGNRLIAHTVFGSLDPEWKSATETEFGVVVDEAKALVPGVYEDLEDLVESEYEGSYLASLFKNASKCRTLSLLLGAG